MTGDRNSFGIPETGQLLRLARSVAGFSSARAAAIHYGWSEPAIRAHESGTRRIGLKDAEKYAAAFRIPVDAFNRADAASLEIRRLHRENSTFASRGDLPVESSAAAIGARLKLARKLRGFARASDLCLKYEFVLPTLASHEAGINAVTERMAEAYSEALGISSAWLLRGELPSMLGDEADKLLVSTRSDGEIDVGALMNIAKEAPTPNRARLSELIDTAKGKRAPASSIEDELFEVDPASVGRAGEIVRVLRTWKLPKGLVQTLFGASPTGTIILALEPEAYVSRRGDRVFVDTSRRDASAGGEFAYRGGGGRVLLSRNITIEQASQSSDTLIGKVVARLTPSSD